MISQVEHYEALYKEKLDETSYFKEFNAEKGLETFEDEFRKIELSIERVQHLQTKYNADVKVLHDNMDTLQFMKQQIKKCSFCGEEVRFGHIIDWHFKPKQSQEISGKQF